MIFIFIAMRKLLRVIYSVFVLFTLIYVGLLIQSSLAKPHPETLSYKKRGGTAVVITGAASRIAQEVALLEQLQKTGWLNNVCFISGTSSGALNTVMLNAILENKFSWERYHSILFGLNNDDIFIRNGRALPANNIPYSNLLMKIVNDSLGYNRIGDLPIPSSISISDIAALPPHSKTYRLSNLKINNESHSAYKLVEALIASTAIPVIFPPARFSESFGLPNTSFVDGGLGDDHLPYTAVLQYEEYRNFGVDTLIIVSRKSDTEPDLTNELQNFGNNDSRFTVKINLRIENMAKNGFIRSMKKLQHDFPELAARTYVYIPDFPDNFPLLDFNDLKGQYQLTADWVVTHKPVHLDQYLAENEQN